MAWWERQALLNVIHTAAHGAALNPMHALALELCSSGGSSAAGVLRRLLDADASTLDAVDAQGNTLLHFAARAGSTELVTLLLTRQPSLCTAHNAAGHSARDVARSEPIRTLIRIASPPDPATDCHMNDSASEELVPVEDDSLSLLNLPEELQAVVLTHLAAPDLLRMRETCRRFHAVADGDGIWERLCWTTYRRAARTSCLAGTWREIYIEHTLLQGGGKARISEEREQRYLDRRSLAGLEPCSRRSVEQPTI